MATCKRWLGQLVGIAVLVAAGWFAFDYAKSRPRCVITCKTHAIHFSDDGNTLITGYSGMQLGPIFQGGDGTPPLEVWDTRTGKVVRTLFNEVVRFDYYALCPERNRVALNLAQKVCVADWQTGEEWDIALGPGVAQRVSFAPRGDMLVVQVKDAEEGLAHLLLDADRGVVIQRWPGEFGDWGFNKDASRWHFVRDGRLHAWNVAERRVEGTLAVHGRLQFNAGDSIVTYLAPDDLALVICDARRMKVTNRLKPAWTARPNIADPAARAKIIDAADFAFSPSGRLAATHMSGYRDLVGPLELWDVAAGRRIAALPEFQKGSAWFIDDDTLLFVDYTQPPPLTRYATPAPLARIDIKSGAIRWKRPAFDSRFFPIDETTALCATPDGTWDFTDLATGQTRRSLPQPFVNDASLVMFNKDTQLLCNMGRRHGVEMPISWREWLHRWIDTESGGVQVIDARGQRVLADLHCSVTAGGVISGDGTTLCVYDFSFGSTFGTIGPSPPESHTFWFYDLHNNKPWLWAVAAPAGIMIVWLLWRTWRGRRGKATTPAATVGPGSNRGEPAA